MNDQSPDQGLRYNTGKPQLSLVLEAPNALRGVARVLEFGAKKYDRSNWKRGLPYTEITDSLLRHMLAFFEGEELDAESGLPHTDHIATNALFLSEMRVHKPECDDRSPTHKTSGNHAS